MNTKCIKKGNWNILSENRNIIYGISIILIIIFHYFEDVLNSPSGINKEIHNIAVIYNVLFGSIGVEIFLFLSGIGLYFSLEKGRDVLKFYSKRIKRIIIPYVIIGLVYWGCVDIWINGTDLGDICYDFLFISLFTEGKQLFWYVAFIITAYAIYPIIYSMIKRYGGKSILIISVIGILIQFIPRLLFKDVYINAEIYFTRFLIFFIGAYCGQKVFEKKNVEFEDYILIIGGAIQFILYLFIHYLHILPICDRFFELIGERIIKCFWGISMTFILVIVTTKIIPKIVQKFLEYIGKITYELFLTHVAIRDYMKIINYQTSNLVNYIFCIGISFVLAIVIHEINKKVFSLTSGKMCN